MKCEDCRAELTAYLEGELEGDRGGALRGHLRSCADCRTISQDESALRDGLRSLPPLDPPASLWAGVQAQLAAAEAKDSEQPRWRRTFARWWSWQTPRYALGGLAAAAVVIVLWSKLRAGAPAEEVALAPPPVLISPVVQVSALPKVVDPNNDVTAALEHEPVQLADDYRQAVDELVAQVPDVARTWTDVQRAAFDRKLGELRTEAEAAEAGKPGRRAWEKLVGYLEGALTRDDVALAGGAR